MNKQNLLQSLDAFVKHTGHFPTRREFRTIGSETKMYSEFGGMKQLKDWYLTNANAKSSTKEDFLAILRKSTCLVEYTKYGVVQRNVLTLDPTVIGSYQGKGTSKKASSDVIFAYDVDDERFRAVNVSEIKSIVFC